LAQRRDDEIAMQVEATDLPPDLQWKVGVEQQKRLATQHAMRLNS